MPITPEPRRVFSLFVAGIAPGILLLASSGGSAHSAEPIAPEYQIYAGSTHAHTQLTWSHGEQWAAADPRAKKAPMKISPEGVQGPPESAKLKPDWQQTQGMPAAPMPRSSRTCSVGIP